jgi:hypothetical protein
MVCLCRKKCLSVPTRLTFCFEFLRIYICMSSFVRLFLVIHSSSSLASSLTAAAYLHRCYLRFPLSEMPKHVSVCFTRVFESGSASFQETAAACIFLSTKAEECGRRLRDIAAIVLQKLPNSSQDASMDESPVS